MSLIRKIVEECEKEVIRKELEEKAKQEEEEKRLAEGKIHWSIQNYNIFYYRGC